MKIINVIAVAIILTLITGCSTSPRIKGGTTHYQSAGGAKIEMSQGQDAKMGSSMKHTMETVKEYVLPAGSSITMDAPVYSKDIKQTNSVASVSIISSNMPVRIVVKETVENTLGAAQKNVLGDTIAKLNSLKWISWFGAGVFLFGLATLFYPPLRAIIGSVTCSIAFTVGGVLLMILPVIIVGHEILILCGISGAIGIYFFAHRHGGLSASVKILKDMVETNKPTETPTPTTTTETTVK